MTEGFVIHSDDDFQWMQHTEHGGKAQIAKGAVEDWKSLGWVECDPAPEPDRLHDPKPEPEPELESEPEPEPKPKHTTKRVGK